MSGPTFLLSARFSMKWRREREAFEGKSQASLIAAILAAEPKPLRTLQPLAPLALERVVQTCLAKDPEERWQNTRDIMRQLEWIAEAKAQPEETLPQRRLTRERLAWSAASLLLIALLTSLPFTIAHLRKAPPMDARPMRFSILPPEKTSLGSFALSPDGRWLAFTAATGGKDQLWVQALDGLRSQALPGTEGASYPFWSPDSRLIGFFAGGKLKKDTRCRRAGTNTLRCSRWPRRNMESEWNHCLFAQPKRSRALCGRHRRSSHPRHAKGNVHHRENHRFPHFLPDGRHFLFLVTRAAEGKNGLYLASLDSKEPRRLLADESNAENRSSPSDGQGYLLFVRENSLLAQPFDAEGLQAIGEAFPVAEQVRTQATSAALPSLPPTMES